MSALSKVAAFVLLLDEKLHKLTAAVHFKVADRAYNSAEATFRKNRDRSTLCSVQAQKLYRDRTEAAHRAHAKNLQNIAAGRDAALEQADQLLEDAEDVKLRYEAIGDVTFTKASLLHAEVQKRKDVRAQL